VCLASWNIGSLIGKSIELVKSLRRRRISIACVQETKWVGTKARIVDGFKLWYSGSIMAKNGVGILVDKELVDSVVEVSRKSDRIMAIKVVVGSVILNVVSVYASQKGLSDEVKKRFWEDLDMFVRAVPRSERIFIGGDFNGHIGGDSGGYESAHAGFDFGMRNSGGVAVLDFAIAYDLVVVNSLFKKKDDHLLTLKSGPFKTQIDYFLTRADSRRSCRDCKVIPSECVGSQHRLPVLDVEFNYVKWKRRGVGDLRVKW